MTTVAPAPARRRRWPFVLLAVLLVLVIGISLAWRYRVQVLETGAEQGLRMRGLDGIAFEIAEIELSRIRLENLRFREDGPVVEAADILFDLWGLRICEVRLFRPSITMAKAEDGSFQIVGMPDFGGGEAKANLDTPQGQAAFPAMPELQRLKIIDGAITINTEAKTARGSFDADLTRTGNEAYRAEASGYLADDAGRAASISAPELMIAYAPTEAKVQGELRVSLADRSNSLTGGLGLWLEHIQSPSGASETIALITKGKATAQGVSVGDLRGRVMARQSPGRAPKVIANLQMSDLNSSVVAADVIALNAEYNHGAASLGVDGAGAFGFLGFTADMPQDQRFVVTRATGDVDVGLAALLLPGLQAKGRVQFDGDMTAPLAAVLSGAALQQIIGQTGGRAEIKLAAPKLSYGALIQEGSARGLLNVTMAGTGATITSPGLIISGAKLPSDLLAAFPPDIARAFREPAFVRLGGPGLSATAITISQTPDGGFAATGKLGLGISNQKLALSLDGDAALSINAQGRVEQFDSEAMSLRLVDGEFGPAKVSGLVALTNVSGAGETLTADAALSLQAKGKVAGYRLRAADIDLSGPLVLNPQQAAITPKPGGRIQVKGFSGPLLTFLDPVRLTLTREKQRRVIYDRVNNRLDLSLGFAGFKTRALINSEDTKTPFTLALGNAAVQIDPKGVDLSLLNASGLLPAYDLAVENVDARVRLGTSKAQNGGITVGSIRHTASMPAFAPLSLNVKVKGRGDALTFDGALKAASNKATLEMSGGHNLSTGLGEANFQLGPVVFAPGVVQPQDFAPPLYRLLLETIGEAAASARIAWNPDGITSETAQAGLSLDKLSTGEIAVEQSAADLTFARLFPLRTAGPQRVRIGRLDVGVPLTHGVLQVDIKSPQRVDIDIERFELFGGLISSQRLSIDPTAQSFDAVLKVTDIDLASILAFAEFGELSATGTLEGVIPIRYENGELTVHDGLLRTGASGGVLKYKPRALDKALEDANESTGLAVKALSNFAYDEISIRINEIEAEDLRLDIKISGKSLDLYGGLPFEFNIKVEGPIRQIIQENLAPPQLPPEIQDLIEQSRKP